MNFQAYKDKHKQAIEDEKESALLFWQRRVGQQVSSLKTLSELLVTSNTGGKNLRGTLVCLGYELYAKKKRRDMFTIAAAYEILHTSLLIHDDIMDKSTMRRGKPTVYQQLGGDHYGISQAISLGDVGFFLATKMINEITGESKIKSSIITQFLQIVLDTITGQMLDVKLSQTTALVTEKDVITTAKLKTAHYTIAGPLSTGALLADADKKVITKLTAFGEALGIAFQIKDDILGVFGDEQMIGKSATSDITEGKQTLLYLHARQNATNAQKNMLDQIYGKGKITAKDSTIIKQIFQETGALTKTENMVERYTHKARLLVPNITTEKTMQQLLTDFISYLLERKK